MSKVIEIPGTGNVEFPDDMSDDDIASAIKAQQGQPGAAPAADQPNWAMQNIVKPLAGVGESVLHKGTQLLAYPVGLAAGAGAYLNPFDRAANASVMANGDQEAWKRAGETRRAVENAWTYEPKLDEGKAATQELDSGLSTVMKPVTWAADKAAGGTEALYRAAGAAPWQQQAAGDIVRESVPLLAIPAAGRLAKSAAASVAPKLGDWAESAAVRSTNADRTATTRNLKGSETARQALGRFMLDENIPLRSPQAIKDAARGIQGSAGPEIGRIAQAADQSGATADLQGAVNAAKASRPIASLAKNTVTRTAYDQITGMLDDQIAQNGGKVTPSVAHDIRKQLDQLADWDQTAPKPVKAGWRAARDAVDAELDKAMQSAGMGDQWSEANQRFAQASKLSNPKNRGMADVGAARRAGNRLGSPSEKAAAIGGAIAAGLHNPIAGIAIPAGTVALNRFGFPVAATVLDAASRAAGGLSAPTTSTPIPASTRAAIAATVLGSRAQSSPGQVPIGLGPAVAQGSGSYGETPVEQHADGGEVAPESASWVDRWRSEVAKRRQPLIASMAGEPPRLPEMLRKLFGPVEQHAEGGEVAPEEARSPGTTPEAQSMEDEAKRDFLRSSTDPAYRAARGPYRPDVAPAVRPNR